MYLLIEGELEERVWLEEDHQQVTMNTYKVKGSPVGFVPLMRPDAPRTEVVAKGHVKCLAVRASIFSSVPGPVVDELNLGIAEHNAKMMCVLVLPHASVCDFLSENEKFTFASLLQPLLMHKGHKLIKKGEVTTRFYLVQATYLMSSNPNPNPNLSRAVRDPHH